MLNNFSTKDLTFSVGAIFFTVLGYALACLLPDIHAMKFKQAPIYLPGILQAVCIAAN